jgi:hypothetical protein
LCEKSFQFVFAPYSIDDTQLSCVFEKKEKKKKMSGVIFKIDFVKAYDSVMWDSVEEVLENKGFGSKIKDRILSRGGGDIVCININGDNGTYFKTHRGCGRVTHSRLYFLISQQTR